MEGNLILPKETSMSSKDSRMRLRVREIPFRVSAMILWASQMKLMGSKTKFKG